MKKTLFTIVLFVAFFCMAVEARSAIYKVGPGQALSELDQVPFDDLKPGDQVKIYYRREPYRAPIILRACLNILHNQDFDT